MPTVGDLLSCKKGEVFKVTANATVRDAAKAMAQHAIGSVVVAVGDRVEGIFTERDLLNRVVAVEKDMDRTLVKEVMSSPVVCCEPNTRLLECKSIMTEKKLRHLPVVQDGEMIGMLSIGDINARECADQAHTIKYLHDYLHGRM